MTQKISTIKSFRLFLLKQVEGLTAQQLNHIPAGHNNNIIWNLAHLNSAAQNMCYGRAGLSFVIEDKYISPFMPGTKPEGFITENDIENIKELLITSIDKLQLDFEKKIFDNYSPSVMIPKVYGFEVNNIHQAIDYLLYHEGYHTGYVMAIKNLL